MKSLVVSLHDVAPSKAELCRRWVDQLEVRGLRASLLVVPGQWNAQSLRSSPKFVEWLREAHNRGHEIVLHGYQHQVDNAFRSSSMRSLSGRLLARGCEEFWELPYDEAMRRLQAGKQELEDHGFSPSGFVAPGWLMSPETLIALRQLGFSYTNTHLKVTDLKNFSDTRMLVLSQRPQSLFTRLGIVFNSSMTSALLTKGESFRLAIHPNDLVNKRVREANLDIIDRAMAAGYTPITYADLLHQSQSPDSISKVHRDDS